MNNLFLSLFNLRFNDTRKIAIGTTSIEAQFAIISILTRLLKTMPLLFVSIEEVKRCDQHVKECQHVCEDTSTGIKCSCFDGFRAEGSSCIGNPNVTTTAAARANLPFRVSHFYIFPRGKLIFFFFFRNLIFLFEILSSKLARIFFVWNIRPLFAVVCGSPRSRYFLDLCQFYVCHT